MNPNPLSAPPNIMIVDDTPVNLRLLDGMLRGQGYRVRSFPRGRLALTAALNEPPDLILLDINMPEMNGYQVCEQMKADKRLADIPIIFLSALNETLDKIRAFGCGGVDYITKPFQFQEVQVRIETQLNLRKLQQNLSAQNDELRAMEVLRDDLVHMVVHDLRAPLTALTASLDFLISSAKSNLSKVEKTCATNAFHGALQLADMINTLLDINRMESGKMPLSLESENLVSIARAAADTLTPLLQQRQVHLDVPETPPMACCDATLIRRLLTNLIDNAIRHTDSQGEICIAFHSEDGFVIVSVTNDGPEIPAEYHDKIFQKFGQVGAKQAHTTGLGLTFCKLAIEAHGGSIGIRSEPGQGCTFWFTLPEE